MSAVTAQRPSDPGHQASGLIRRVSDAGHSVLESLHITRHHEERPPCKLAEAVLARVELELGDGWTQKDADFCDPACLQRYLRARGMDVG